MFTCPLCALADLLLVKAECTALHWAVHIIV